MYSLDTPACEGTGVRENRTRTARVRSLDRTRHAHRAICGDAIPDKPKGYFVRLRTRG